jgi:glycosyltransferase involved in cell wall biosynthesis
MFPKPNTYINTVICHRWFGGLIASAAAKFGFVDPILWIYCPEYSEALGKIPHKRLVFDLADDLAAYNTNVRRYRYISSCVDKLARKADLMVVTSPTLLDKYRNKTEKCVFVPNGFDEKLFDGKPKPVPSDLAGIPRPVIGFVGVLFSFLDYDMIYDAATAIPEASFVFVGPVEKSGRAGVERLETLSNTYFLGRKPKHDIPAYVSNFDVCINPFKVDNVSRSASPLKVIEYLACGKPVVSAPMEGLSRAEVGKWIRFAERDHFAAALAKALSGLAAAEIDTTCMEAVWGFSWTIQFRKLKGYLEEL